MEHSFYTFNFIKRFDGVFRLGAKIERAVFIAIVGRRAAYRHYRQRHLSCRVHAFPYLFSFVFFYKRKQI